MSEEQRRLAEALLAGGLLDPEQVARGAPTSVGGYRLERLLGSGASSQVFLAISGEGAPVAVKLLRRATPHAVERLRRELRALAGLNHPNVIRALGAGLAGETPYVIVEYAPRGALAGSALPLGEAVAALADVAEGVGAAHALGVVHRDLKPSNVLLGPPAKVADFGLVHLGESTLTRAGQFVGTPAYAAPERLRVQVTAADPREDVYALGVMLYERLTGRRPYAGRAVDELIHAQDAGPPPRPDASALGVPPELVETALRALSRDPAQRHASGRELAAELWRALGAGPSLSEGETLRLSRELGDATSPHETTELALEVGPLLGRGGFGAVYRARDHGLGRDVALKILHADPSPTQIRRFAREGELLAALQHPGILGVHSAGQLPNGRPYLVLELIDGAAPLDAAFAQQTLPERAELVQRVAEAVAAAHVAGIVHRDLKPENVLVRAGEVKVLDFGVARLLDSTERLTRSGALVGTPLHMAPEQLVGDRASIGPQTDVWALGVILYQALTGELPFEGETFMELVSQIAAGAYASPSALDPDVPPGLEVVCCNALAAKPHDRYPDAGAFAADLQLALAGERPRRRWTTGQRRGLLLGAGAALLALILGLAWSSLPEPSPLAPAPSNPPEATVAPVPSAAVLLARARQLLGTSARDEARALLRQAVDLGHAPAMVALAELGGQGASDLYRAAAAQGEQRAMVALGLSASSAGERRQWFERARAHGAGRASYELARDEALTPTQRVALQREGAERGWAPAMAKLGLALQLGEGAAQDEREAREWFQRAADRGLAEGCFRLGVMLLHGEGGAKDVKRGREWLWAATRSQHLSALKMLQAMFANGIGASKDEAKAGSLEQFLSVIEFWKVMGRAERCGDCGGMWQTGEGSRCTCASPPPGAEGHALSVLRDAVRAEAAGSKQALELLQRAAKLGGADAMHRLGRFLAVRERQPQAAIPWLRRSAAKKYVHAVYDLGLALWMGLGVDRDRKRSHELILEAADLGSRRAMYTLALYYKERDDWTRAFVWLERAVAKGHLDAAHHLAALLWNGRGGPQDRPRAIRVLRRAACAGNPDAMSSLGSRLILGQGVPRDPVEAVQWYRRGAALGNVSAMTFLGACLYSGKGVAADRAMSQTWYRRAAELGGAEAMYMLATRFGFPDREALVWYHRAAKARHGRAMLNLAGYYLKGQRGLQQDPDLGLRYLQASAQTGLMEGMYSWGYELLVRRKDVEAGLRWWHRASKTGNPRVLYNLGLAYLGRYGVEADYAVARRWFGEGAQRGVAPCMTQLGSLWEQGRGGGVDLKRAAALYQRAAQAGDDAAMHRLGLCYAVGQGVEKNQAQAKVWFERGAKRGHPEAMFELGRLLEATDREAAAAWYQRARADAGVRKRADAALARLKR